MKRTSIKLALLGATALLPALQANAIDYQWNVLGGGSQSWHTPTNWTPNGVPNSVAHSPSLSVPLTGNLDVSIGAIPTTLGGLDIGGTNTAVTTDVSATGAGRLIFSNIDDPDFDDNGRVDGDDMLIWQRNLGLTMGVTNALGDANGDGIVSAADLRAWRQGYGATATPPLPPTGRAVINSNGVVGSINTISAPVQSGVLVDATPTYRDETVEIRGTRSLNLSGGYLLAGPNNTINSFLPDGATTSINGILLEESTELTPTTDRSLNINTSNTALGRIEIPGVISGGGGMLIGHASPNVPFSTIVLSGNNTYTGRLTFNRANIVLAHDNALGNAAGGAEIRPGNPSNHTGFNISSDNDARTAGAEMRLAQFVNFTGSNSLTWTGVLLQSNSRGLINTIAQGKQLTLTGNIYGGIVADGTLARVLVFDGSGKTVVTGSVNNRRYNDSNGAAPIGGTNANSEEAEVTGVVNGITKGGSGALYLNGSNSYAGPTIVNGGNFHFGLYDDTVITPVMLVNFGAIGATTFKSFGSDDTLQTNLFFLARLAPTSTGGIMVNPSDADPGDNFDFTANANIAKMSLAAPEGGLTYNGSITPAESTYRLGGGSGTLTLPTAQLTGGNSLIVTNGGVVDLRGANTYSGTTSVLAKYTSSLTAQALATGTAPSASNDAVRNRVYGGTVLAATNLQNGGVPSSIGSSSSVAANLVIQGSTLRYTGTGSSTDRLLTVGTGGAAIESSGDGAIAFTNTGALAMDEPEARSATKTNGGSALNGITNFDDLVVGMPVSGPGIAANTTISNITLPGATNSATPTLSFQAVTLSANATDSNTDSLTFTSIARTLTLGGSNVGDNTLRPNIVNGAAATSVVKADGGKWILTGTANTYTGTTTVNGGALLVNGAHTGGGAYTVASGGILGGTGSIGTTTITVNGELSPGNPLTDGVLTVTGGATFNAGSTLRVELAGPNPGDYDELNLSGALVAGGTFDVDLLGGYVPGIGASFDVLDFTPAATGTFTFSLPALPVGRIWNTSSVLTTGTISVQAGIAAVPEPSSIVLVASCLAAVAAGRSRRRAVAAR